MSTLRCVRGHLDAQLDKCLLPMSNTACHRNETPTFETSSAKETCVVNNTTFRSTLILSLHNTSTLQEEEANT